jgi:hypothetical protein
MPELCSTCFEFDCICDGTVATAPIETAGDALIQATIGRGIGRGPTGKLRNFKAMNPAKLQKVWHELNAEEFVDDEALDACADAFIAKGLPKPY